MTSAQLTKKIKELVAKGKLRVLKHACERMALRGYTLPEIEQVLQNGFHDLERDEYDMEHNIWRHVITGSTTDGKKTRVVVAIIDELLIITVVGPLK
jgi:hypothetical protein